MNSFGKIVQRIKKFVDSFPLTKMYSLLFLVFFLWLIGMIVNESDCGRREMNVYIKNIIVVFIMVGNFVVMH
jgi:hypothetical protein